MTNRSRQVLETALTYLKEEESRVHECVIGVQRVLEAADMARLPEGPPPVVEIPLLDPVHKKRGPKPKLRNSATVADPPKRRTGRRTNAQIALDNERAAAIMTKRLPPSAIPVYAKPDARCQRGPCNHSASDHIGSGGKCMAASCWCSGFVGLEQFGSTKSTVKEES